MPAFGSFGRGVFVFRSKLSSVSIRLAGLTVDRAISGGLGNTRVRSKCLSVCSHRHGAVKFACFANRGRAPCIRATELRVCIGSGGVISSLTCGSGGLGNFLGVSHR